MVQRQMTARQRPLVTVLVAGMAVLVVGCSGDSDPPPVTATPTTPVLLPDLPTDRVPPPSYRQTVDSNTQATFRDVRVGVGNIWVERYTDETGGAREGLTAALFISVPDDPAQDMTLRVHPGQRFTAGGLTFGIIDVRDRQVDLLWTDGTS